MFSLRHPCDVVLSNVMQNYRHNAITSHFDTLERSAALYASVMSLWQSYRQRLPMRLLTVRYEELVEDWEGCARDILGFLGLPWSDHILEYRQQAQQAGLIKTPSYHQVVEPVHKRAVQRWLAYRDEMSPVLPVLEPFVQDFGYGSCLTIPD